MSKKFYWLKLNDNFFDREEIKVLETMQNGKDYVIFYMKLLLKSVKTSGQLRFRDVIPYTPEILSSITNTNVDTVRVAIDLFVSLGLMEKWDDGTLFMSETQNMIGSETDSAKKMREKRKRDNKMLNKPSHCDYDVTTMCENVKKSDIEIEKEIEKDIDIEKEEEEKKEKKEEVKSKSKKNKSATTPATQVEALYSHEEIEIKKEFDANIRPVTPMEMNKLIYFTRDLKIDYLVVIEAIKESVINNARTVRYIESILINWHEKNIKTMQDLQAYQRDFKDKKKNKSDVKGGVKDASSVDAKPNKYANQRKLVIGG